MRAVLSNIMENKIRWIKNSIQILQADTQRSSETNLLRVWLPATPNITLYLKDESNHKTGSLKHRLAKSLFMRALLRGHLSDDTTIIEASSGNTAVSESYFAQILNLPYIAVMVKTTSQQKIKCIEKFGGKCHLIERDQRDVEVAKALAAKTGGYFMNQFESAKKVFGISYSDNITRAILDQMIYEPYPQSEWFVCGAGTGCTAQAFTNHILKNNLVTKLCVVDPEFSVYFDYYLYGDNNRVIDKISRIEGIGRRKVEASFNPNSINRMLKIPDEASIAASHFIKNLTGLEVGGSTGTNIYSALYLINEMHAQGKSGSVVTLLCDKGSLYQSTYYNDKWLQKEKLDINPYYQQIETFYQTGIWKKMDSIYDSKLIRNTKKSL